MRLMAFLISVALSGTLFGADKNKKKPEEPSALDKYIQEALSHGDPTDVQPSAGSLWNSRSRLSELGSDIRAVQVNDLVTIVVSEQASAVVTGDANTSRNSSVDAAITSLFGPRAPPGLWLTWLTRAIRPRWPPRERPAAGPLSQHVQCSGYSRFAQRISCARGQ